MSRESSHTRIASSSSTKCANEQCPYAEEDTRDHQSKHKSLFSVVKKPGPEKPVTVFCDECSEFVNQKINAAEQSVLSKQSFIQLLQEQLEQLKDRNIRSINDAQEVYYKYGLAQQELLSLQHICTKYDDELQKLRAERCRAPEPDHAASKLKEEAERWKKQYEDLLTKLNLEDSTARGEGTEDPIETTKTTTDEEKLRSIIQNEVTTAVNILKENSQVVISSLDKQNKKLETMVEKLQNDLDTASGREEQLHKDLQSMKDKLTLVSAESEKIRSEYDKNYEDTMKTVLLNNEKLKRDLDKMTKLYTDLQKDYEENVKSIESDLKKSSEINEEFNIVKDEYRALTRSLSSLSEEIVKAKENALAKNEELRQQVAEMGPAANMKQFVSTITESLESIEVTCACKPGNEVSEQVTELNNSIADVEKINKLNSDIELKISEVKNGKKINCLQEENKKLKEDIVQRCDNLISKVRESGEELEIMSGELRSKNDVIENQCLQICTLSEIIENEKQKNDMLECDLECLKTAIQKEKSSNTKLSKENEELKSDLEAFLQDKKSLEEKNISLKSSLSETEKENEDLNKKLQEAVATINEMKAMIQASQDRMEKLEKANQELKEIVDSLKKEASEVHPKEYEDKINKLVEENKTLKQQLEKEKENINSLKKHIDSLQFYHENEMKANNTRLDEVQEESKAIKINLQTEINKLTNMNELLQQKLDVIESENKQLRDKITELNDEITALNDKLQNTDILQDPQKYVDALDAINQENIEMKAAMNNLREILEVKLGEKVNSVSDLLAENIDKKISTQSDKASQNEYSENESDEIETVKLTVNLTKDNCKKNISCKQSCTKNKTLVQKVNSIEKKIGEIVDDVSISPEYIKSTSMPNLEDIGDDFEPQENVIVSAKSAPIQKSSSVDFIGKSEKTGDKDCCESKWEKHLESIHKLRTELTEILAKIDENRKSGDPSISLTESTSKRYSEKYKELINNIQKQINELQEKSSQGNIKNNGLQEFKGIKEQMCQQSPQMEEELYRLRKELYKQKVERVKDKEVAEIKREADILAAQQQLKSIYLESKKKLLLDLAAVQNALQVKNEEETKIKQKCDALIKEVTANQEARKKKLHDISLIATQPLLSNVQKIVICDVPGASHSVCKPECSGYPEKPVKPHALVINARKKLNALEKHRLSTESVPEQSGSDEELKKKYLLL